jgi:hypothetical protein
MIMVFSLFIQTPYAAQAQSISDQLPVLALSDCPEAINVDQFVAGRHVERLFEEEADPNAIVFRNADTTNTMYLFSEPIKYIDEVGNIRDKSNKLYPVSDKSERISRYAYVNDKNDIRTYFPVAISNEVGVLLTYNEIEIELLPLIDEATDAQKATVEKISYRTEHTTEDYVYYYGVFGKDTALRYTPVFSGFKEDIVLFSNVGNEYSFLLRTGGLTPNLENGRIYLLDAKKEVAGIIEEIFIFDSAKERNESYNGDYTLEKTNNVDEYIVRVTVDKGFLEDPKTVYPVYIDPTITINVSGSGTSKTIQDTPVYSGVLTNSQGANIWNVIGFANTANPGWGVGRTLMRFPGLTNNSIFLNTSNAVTNITLHLFESSGKTTSSTIRAHQYTGNASWIETGTAYNNMTWNGFGTQYDMRTFSASNSWVTFNLTGAATSWRASSTDASRGIMLINSNETSDANRRDFRATEHSTNRPFITMDYIQLPSTQTTGITTNRVYTIRNTFSSHTMDVNNGLTTTGTTVVQRPSNGAARQKYRLIYVSNGEYKIEPMHAAGVGRVLSLNSSKQLIIDTDTNASNRRWYIIRSGSNFNIINKAFPSEMLSVNGSTASGASIFSSSNSNGAIWQIQPVNRNVNVRLLRHTTFNTTFGTTAQAYANQVFNHAAPAFFNKWGLTLTQTHFIPAQNFAVDNCPEGYVNNCVNTCTRPVNACTNCRHKCGLQLWHDVRNNFPTNSTYGLTTCFFTFSACSSRGGTDHSTVWMSNSTNTSTREYLWNVRRVQHEISHCFGVPDNSCVSVGLERCLMNTGFDNIYTYDQDDLWCSNCQRAFLKDKFQ